MEKEIRSIQDSAFDVEFREDGGIKTIVGYGIVFGVRSVNLGGFVEVIDERAFNDSTDTTDVVGLINHDNNMVLGRTSSGTMRLEKDTKGVRYFISPPNTSYARDLAESIKRGDIKGSSFAFGTAKGGDLWVDEGKGLLLRTVTQFSRVSDMSVVTNPAYLQTSVALRSLEDYKKTINTTITPIHFQSEYRKRQLQLLKNQF